MPETGFADRLAYLRWLRNRGRVKPETDAEVADWLGVGIKWFGKWKGRAKAPGGIAEAKAVARALADMGVSVDWLYDGVGKPPEPERWKEWTNPVPFTPDREAGARDVVAADKKAAQSKAASKKNGGKRSA